MAGLRGLNEASISTFATSLKLSEPLFPSFLPWHPVDVASWRLVLLLPFDALSRTKEARYRVSLCCICSQQRLDALEDDGC